MTAQCSELLLLRNAWRNSSTKMYFPVRNSAAEKEDIDSFPSIFGLMHTGMHVAYYAFHERELAGLALASARGSYGYLIVLGILEKYRFTSLEKELLVALDIWFDVCGVKDITVGLPD